MGLRNPEGGVVIWTKAALGLERQESDLGSEDCLGAEDTDTASVINSFKKFKEKQKQRTN